MNTRMFLAAAGVAVALAACGGGGGGGPSFGLPPPPDQVPPPPAPPPPPPPPPAPAPAPAPAAISAHYKFLNFQQDRDPATEPAEKRYDDYIALLNREGAAGYRYVDGLSSGNIVSLQDHFMMVKDTETTYTYEYKRFEVDIMSSDALPRLLQQMKEQGAKGMVFVKLLGMIDINSNNNGEFGMLYRKDAGSSATFDFAAADIPPTSGDFANLANAMGAQGFRPWVTPLLRGHTQQFFVKDQSSAARYELKAVLSPLSVVDGDEDDVKAQIREQGAAGYRLLKARFMEDSKQFIFYVKDTTQSSRFEYEFLDNPDSIFGLQEANATQANGQTALGLRYFGLPDTPVFLRSLSCTGPLCLTPDGKEISDGS
ncbi:hypothetical protein [Variovorax sp. EBFNA2]|uniref:hypothetical protein n=1 Tax=Variovorax sp. EBFNA2 TaxID=3342097 RepID=UPI0029C0C820|nr:hypothetical protein [Variovorax boronicumulans]WPG35756.1 hypothetical protein RZE79_19940 [Variovorax boronicumulans]